MVFELLGPLQLLGQVYQDSKEKVKTIVLCAKIEKEVQDKALEDSKLEM
jgi:hypothetical protein